MSRASYVMCNRHSQNHIKALTHPQAYPYLSTQVPYVQQLPIWGFAPLASLVGYLLLYNT